MEEPSRPSTSTGGGGYSEDLELCKSFLSEFQSIEDDPTEFKYKSQLQCLSNRTAKVLVIELDDIQSFVNNNTSTSPAMIGFVTRVIKNTSRYIKLFYEAIEALLPAPTMDLTAVEDILDVLRHQRLERQSEDEPYNESNEAVVKSLFTRYEVHLWPLERQVKSVPLSIRKVKASLVGSLISIRGMVTRVSDVKPLLSVATYTCDTCSCETYQHVGTKTTFLPVKICQSAACILNNNRAPLTLHTKASKFVKYQEVKIQELPDQVPMGHIPRTIVAYLRGELTRTVSPGGIVTVSGVFLPRPFVTSAGRAQVGQLLTDTFLEITKVVNHKKRYSDMDVNPVLEAKVRSLQSNNQHSNLYNILSQSLAPEIYGHADVKKALLLLLIGGVTKKTTGGMSIRGDINVCLMGDPGVAKSQLLKHIGTVAPRGVYTTGKGSSGVGLTAAVVRDKMTSEMTLEGGALVLADMGICCIDEFDKMEDADRTAIHEVMEQQTVSIAKAGITTTLNARTSVLAAANPIYGRYNRKKTPSENINLPNALLSRFDLMFLILDVASVENDTRLARHVAYVHRYVSTPALEFEPVAEDVLRYYIAIAKQFEPVIPPELTHYIVEAYVTLRQEDAKAATERKEVNGQTAMTARQLLSILRLAQALARLQFASEVTQEDVDEAMRLVYVSKSSLLEENDQASAQKKHYDVNSKIYRIIINAGSADDGVEYSVIEPIVLRKGFTKKQLDECIKSYVEMEVFHQSANKTRITFV